MVEELRPQWPEWPVGGGGQQGGVVADTDRGGLRHLVTYVGAALMRYGGFDVGLLHHAGKEQNVEEGCASGSLHLFWLIKSLQC